jgi:hypothetical protein
VILEVSGGTSPYTYNPENPETTGLSEGSYTYTVTDANGCEASVTATINVAPSAILFTATPTQPLCNGQAGTVILEVSGGTSPYTYNPENPETTGLSEGSYTYTVTDANGCEASVTVTINAAPSVILFTATPTQPLCNGQTGSVILEVSGGTSPYTYNPENPETTGLSEGSYTYTVTDANGCEASVTTTINAAPSAILFTATPIQPLCNGQTGSVILEVSGGTSPYTYNPENPETTGLSAGFYTYNVTDANGCIEFTMVDVVEPEILQATETHTLIEVNGGISTVTISANGGTSPYSGTGIFTQSAGTIIYTVSDANGCTSDVSVTLTEPPKTLNINLFLEGLYNGGGTMRKAQDEFGDHFNLPIYPANTADLVNVELHNASDYSSIAFTFSNLNLSISGLVSFAIPGTITGSYYITVKHRNSLETTTAMPVSFAGGTINYSFDTPAKAYGNNLLLMIDGRYVIYGGDVNQDGLLDSEDMTPIDNLISIFGFGYLNEDINGDGLMDSSDITIVENNAAGFISAKTP